MTQENNTLPLFIQLNMTALEDLHTGSGTGGGDIDAFIQTDRDEHPIIRASHFKGLLREAGDDLIALKALEQEELDHLLGQEGKKRGALKMTSLQVQEGGKTLVWGSTQYQEGSRTPKDGSLRFIEFVAAGTSFRATLRLPNEIDYPLLERLLNRVDRVGGDRNRGGGLVKVYWKKLIPEHNTQATPPNKRLRLLLRNLEPLCLPTTGFPGNLIQSHSFIRGQTLLGAFMAWAIQSGRSDALPLFNHLSVGDALPIPILESIHEQPTFVEAVIPIPLSILTEKPKATPAAATPNLAAVNHTMPLTLPWWAGGSSQPKTYDSLDENITPPDEKAKRPGIHEYLCRLESNSSWLRYTPTMRVRLRNQNRKNNQDTQLFSMEEISENTDFQMELRFNNSETAKAFWEAFSPILNGEDWLFLGREGRPMRINSFKAMPNHSIAALSKTPTFVDNWVLTLVSDLIVRGQYLGFLDNLDLTHLCKLADITKEDHWKIEKDIVESEQIRGFNAITGLQRAPVLALRRGSCWKISGKGSGKLAEALLKKTAIGERTKEGFGRFLIDVQFIRKIEKPKPTKPPLIRNTHEEILQIARTLSQKIGNNGPSLSQLQGLRDQALSSVYFKELEDILKKAQNAHKERPQGGEAWEYFPWVELTETLQKFTFLDEKSQLISYLVQWRILDQKENHP